MLTGIDGKAPELFPYYEQMNSWLNASPVYNDNRTIIRLNAFFRFFSLGHYYVHVVFINFLSFTGLFCLYKSFLNYLPEKKTELLFLTFLMPSMMFWGSGLLKDGLLISGFGIFIYSLKILEILKKKKIFFIYINVPTKNLLFHLKFFFRSFYFYYAEL